MLNLHATFTVSGVNVDVLVSKGCILFLKFLTKKPVKMGRRSINTTKSGKYMNPTDQARKYSISKLEIFRDICIVLILLLHPR